MTPVPRVAALTIYPLKSAAGIEVSAMELDAWGAVGDRRWLLVDDAGQAITARTVPALLTIAPQVVDTARDGTMTLTAPGRSPMVVPVPEASAPLVPVQIWDDAVVARAASHEASAWCADVLGQSCRLVRVSRETQRPLAPRFAGPLPFAGRHVTFTDGAPLLVLGLASIEALNARLVEQGAFALMDRRRFRANIWLDGLAPHAEDTWRAVRIGDVALGLGSRCPRCVLTTIDPDTLERGAEPLRTMATYRREGGGVVFGINTTHADPGWIRVRDEVTVDAMREDAPPAQ
ncbi:MAG: MOSC domain-containing protein [Gemmatimonadaceae bacterium]|nr:MOSC domain-containing protein [Gemmatimonadaceae bacterium]